MKESFYDSREWKELRFRVLIHYQRRCMACYATNKQLHVDHIKPRSKFPELELKFSNLQILCDDCNIGKSNIYYHDLRPDAPVDSDELPLSEKGYLMSTKKFCHIWDGKDTKCRMWSTGGMNKSKAKVYKSPKKNICSICLLKNNGQISID